MSEPVVESPVSTEPPPAPTPAPPPAQEPDWKAEARKWETRAKENKAKLDAAAPKLGEYDKLIEAQKSDLEKAQEAAKVSADRERAANERAVKAQIQRLAADKFVDPDVPFAFIQTDKYISEQGVDETAIAADLDELLKQRPNLARPAGSRPPAPNPAQGSSANGPTTPAQLSDADVKRLYAERKYDEIEQARKDGRLNTILGAP